MTCQKVVRREKYWHATFCQPRWVLALQGPWWPFLWEEDAFSQGPHLFKSLIFIDHHRRLLFFSSCLLKSLVNTCLGHQTTFHWSVKISLRIMQGRNYSFYKKIFGQQLSVYICFLRDVSLWWWCIKRDDRTGNH